MREEVEKRKVKEEKNQIPSFLSIEAVTKKVQQQQEEMTTMRKKKTNQKANLVDYWVVY